MAKSILRSRQGAKKLLMLKSHLQAVSLRMTTLKTTQSMATAMKSATKAMNMMSQRMNMPQLQRLVMEFEKQNEKMEMTQDVMGDALDEAFGEEDEEEESEAMVQQVLTELGIDLKNQLPTMSGAVGAAAPPQREAVAEAAGGECRRGGLSICSLEASAVPVSSD
jgi:charged multivesicular body protein 2A